MLKQQTTARRTPPTKGKKGKLEGLDYVTIQGPEGLTINDYVRRTRKPTNDELRRRYALIQETHAASSKIREAAGLQPVELSFYGKALREAMQAEPAKTPARKPKAAKPKPEPKPAKVASQNGNGRSPVHGDRKPSAKQIYFACAKALDKLGYEFPADRAGADRLIKQLLAA